MKRIVYALLCLLMVFVLFACEANNPIDSNDDYPIEKENEFAFYASSLQDFVDQYAENPFQNSIISLAVNTANLYFESYAIKYITYTPVQTDDGDWNGIIYSDLHWHQADCSSCTASCEVFNLHLVYWRDGIDLGAATKSLNQTDDPNLYTAEVSFNKTTYAYIINDQYYCRYTINNDLLDKDLIQSRLAALCAEIEDALEEGE